MKFKKVNVYHDGTQFIAVLDAPENLKKSSKKISVLDEIPEEMYEKFKMFFSEAQYKRITRKKQIEYIYDRFIESNEELFDIPNEEILWHMYKRYVSCLHSRKKRFFRKAYLNPWNWWTTFTYDSKKLTADEFEHQIRTKLSDLSSHRGWRYMLRWEEGELNERRHLHAVLYVPEGAMVGEMFTDSHRSYKRGNKIEFFTNNTYFAERFGISQWEKIDTLSDNKSILQYMLKYMEKDDGKIIYSRGIPDSIEAVIDVESDVITSYSEFFTTKAVIASNLFKTLQEAKNSLLKAFDLSCYAPVKAEAVPI